MLLLGIACANPPPIFHIAASSLYDAGRQHGFLARQRIQGWFALGEMQAAFAFVAHQPEIFNALKQRNSAAFPELVEELHGVADGADVSLDQIWVANLLSELESLMGQKRSAEHCSDIFAAQSPSRFFHGHNEDWPFDSVKDYWYFLAYRASPGTVHAMGSQSQVPDCAGFVYPGTLLGFAPTWNRYGIYSTMNSVFINDSVPDGLSVSFVGRSGICKSRSLNEAVASMSLSGWSLGTSVNIVDLNTGTMANLEVFKDKHSLLEVSPLIRNYSHFNMYNHPTMRGLDLFEPTTVARQAVLDRHPPPRSQADMAARLSDSPILRKITMASFALDGHGKLLDVWCCGQRPSDTTIQPLHSWNLSEFFDSDLWHTPNSERVLYG